MNDFAINLEVNLERLHWKILAKIIYTGCLLINETIAKGYKKFYEGAN